MSDLLGDLPGAVGWAALHALWVGLACAGLAAPWLARWQHRNPAGTVRAAQASLLITCGAFVAALCSRPTGALPGAVLVGLGVDGAGDPRLAAALDTGAAALGWCWLLGFCLVLAREIGARRALRGWQRGARRVCAARLLGPHAWPGAARLPLVLVRRSVGSPCVVGLLRTRVLLPLATVRALDRAQLAAVLAHEAGHVARRDPLAHGLVRALLLVLFFHPVASWLAARARRAREARCDDFAVRCCGSARAYAGALLALAAGPEAAGRAVPRGALAARDGDLVLRVRRLLGTAPAARHVPAVAVAGLLVAGLSLQVGLCQADLQHTAARSARLREAGLHERAWARVIGRGRPILQVPGGIAVGGSVPGAALPGGEGGCLVVLGTGARVRQDGRALAGGAVARGSAPLVVERPGGTEIRLAVDASGPGGVPQLRSRVGEGGWAPGIAGGGGPPRRAGPRVPAEADGPSR